MNLDEHLDQFAYRVLRDAYNEGTALYWERRAQQFEWAKPRLDDFHGQATKADLSAAWRRCDETARACRDRARVARLEMGGEPWVPEDVPIRRAS